MPSESHFRNANSLLLNNIPWNVCGLLRCSLPFSVVPSDLSLFLAINCLQFIDEFDLDSIKLYVYFFTLFFYFFLRSRSKIIVYLPIIFYLRLFCILNQFSAYLVWNSRIYTKIFIFEECIHPKNNLLIFESDLFAVSSKYLLLYIFLVNDWLQDIGNN